jgi:hypothetical protein
MSDCQWWLTKCLAQLVEEGLLIAPEKGPNRGKDPLKALEEAPKH